MKECIISCALSGEQASIKFFSASLFTNSKTMYFPVKNKQKSKKSIKRSTVTDSNIFHLNGEIKWYFSRRQEPTFQKRGKDAEIINHISEK